MSVKEEEEKCNKVSRKSKHRQDQKARATNIVLYYNATLFDISFESRVDLVPE